MSKKSIVKLYQSNCNPCTMVENFLVDNNVEHESFNVEDRPDIAAKYSVMGVPVTILLDERGDEVTRSVGFKPVELNAIINQL